MRWLIQLLIPLATLAANIGPGDVARINPTTPPSACRTGDLRVDTSDSNKLKMCRSNSWISLLDSQNTATFGNFSGIMTSGTILYPVVLNGTIAASQISSGTLSQSVLGTYLGSVAGSQVDSGTLAQARLGTYLGSVAGSQVDSGTLAQARLGTYLGSVAGSQVDSGTLAQARLGTYLGAIAGSQVSGNISGNAGTATALAANPADCSSNNYATAIAASGDLTCSQVSLSAGVTGTLPVGNGGTGQTSLASNAVLLGGTSLGTVAAGSANTQVLTWQGVGTAPVWAYPGTGTLSVVSKSADYTVTTSDDVVIITSAAAMTLPAATNRKTYRFTYTPSTGTGTIARAGSDTFQPGGGTTFLLNTPSESVTITSDGTSVWYIHSHEYKRSWVAYTPTFTGFGTPSGVNFYSRRVGDSLEVRGSFTAGTATAANASISMGFNGTNDNVTADSTKVGTGQIVGFGAFTVNSASIDCVLAVASGGTVNIGNQSATSNCMTPGTGSGVLGSSNSMTVNFLIPITNWSP